MTSPSPRGTATPLDLRKLEPNGKALDLEVFAHPYDGEPVPEFQWVAAMVGPLPKGTDVVVLSVADAAALRAEVERLRSSVGVTVTMEERERLAMEPEFTDQPLLLDGMGVVRFRENPIVRYLLDWATARGCGMNELAIIDFPPWSRRQFAQLIGYSVGGYSELQSYVDDAAYERAEEAARILRGRGEGR